MSYLPGTQRVSISSLNEVLMAGGDHTTLENNLGLNVPVDQASEKHCGDLLTKGLPHERHWNLCTMIGLGPAPVGGWQKNEPEPETTHGASSSST